MRRHAGPSGAEAKTTTGAQTVRPGTTPGRAGDPLTGALKGKRVSDSGSERFLDHYLGARVPGNPSRDDVLATLREHVSLTVMLGYERDDGAMTVLYKGVLVEASRDPGTGEKADRFALVTAPAANARHLLPDLLAQANGAHEPAAQGEREAAEPLALLPEVPADGIEEYAGEDLRGGYRWPVGYGQTAVVIFSPPVPN